MKTPPGAEKLPGVPPGASVKKLAGALVAIGMEVSGYRLGGGEMALFGIRKELMLAIESRYIPGETPKGGVSMKFAGAKVHDPIGIPRNLEFDYTIGAQFAKDQGYSEERARRMGQRRNANYNDGQQVVESVVLFKTAGELSTWVDEWIDTLKVEYPHITPKKKPKATDLDLMLTNETWTG